MVTASSTASESTGGQPSSTVMKLCIASITKPILRALKAIP